eukprot:PhF_6_TR22529/c5_g2_i1/m.31991/K14684/SLC25A23S; solute carrier family 25 (mitochondrial phosphate transporter), member 23/24/25/41
MPSSSSSSSSMFSRENGITFTAGMIAGCCSRTLTAPLDRIKLLMQEGRIAQHTMAHPTVHKLARDLQRPRYNLPEVIRVVIREGGVKSFWRGNGINCLKAGPEFATMFTVRQLLYDTFSSDGGKSSSFGEGFVLSAAAGATAQGIIYPLELVKARMAVSSAGEYKSIFDCIRQCWVKGGVREF